MTFRLTQNGAPESAEEAAEFWIARQMSGSMDAGEKAAFEQWLAASEENRASYQATRRLLQGIDELAQPLLAESFERELVEEAKRRKAAFQFTVRAAAAVFAVVALSAVLSVFINDAGLSGRRQYSAAVETRVGEARTMSLSDGSEIELNTASKVEVSYSKSSRNVRLYAGEAFFSVEKDKDRPFTVDAGNALVTVTGTAFNVSAFGDRTAIHVLSGVVDVKPQSSLSQTLLAGDMIEIDGSGRAAGIVRFDPNLALAWRSGKARFRETPLRDVIETLNRYFEDPISIQDEDLESLPVTGEFDIHDRTTAVMALAAAFGLKATIEDDEAVLSKPEGP